VTNILVFEESEAKVLVLAEQILLEIRAQKKKKVYTSVHAHRGRRLGANIA